MSIKKYFGTKDFYISTLSLVLPVFIQNLITNFVSLLDNIMVGSVGTMQMSAVAVVNNILFVFNLCIFGGVSGAGIFSAQYYGKGDHDGIRNSLRYKLGLVVALTAITVCGCLLFGEQLIGLFLHDDNAENVAATLKYAKEYMGIMLIGLLPFALNNAYAGTLRETAETAVPMRASVVSILVNLTFNYLLIYGKFGFPCLGVVGAAIATVIARYIEFFIVLIWTHTHKDRNMFVVGLYKSLKVPKKLFGEITKKGLPLMANEAMWSLGISTVLGFYSTRGLDVVAGVNISQTIIDLFNVGFMSFGTVISIIIGNSLGAGRLEQAKEQARQLTVMTFLAGVIISVLAISTSGLFPKLYNTTDEIRTLARDLIIISASFVPVISIVHAAYFVIRSGGKTFITLLFDCGSEWVISVTAAYIISTFTDMPIRPFFAIIQALILVKMTAALILMKKGIWVNNLTE